MIAATQDTSTHTYLALFKLAALEEWHESLHLGATRRFKRGRSVRVSHVTTNQSIVHTFAKHLPALNKRFFVDITYMLDIQVEANVMLFTPSSSISNPTKM